MRTRRSCLRALSSRVRGLLLAGALCTGATLTACGDLDPLGAPESNSDIGSEIELGTESGNPTEMSASEPEVELGTESGNPTAADDPVEDLGTESGNPTRPPNDAVFGVADDGGDAAPGGDDPATPPGEGDDPDAAEVDGAAPTTPGAAADDATSCDAGMCETAAAGAAEHYGMAQVAPAPFDEAVCSDGGVCTCVTSDATLTLAESEEEVCLAQGRMSCLYASSDYMACDVAEPSGCQAACGSVYEAQLLDAKARELSVAASACTEQGCRYVLTADAGECWSGGTDASLEPSDCDAAQEELLTSEPATAE